MSIGLGRTLIALNEVESGESFSPTKQLLKDRPFATGVEDHFKVSHFDNVIAYAC
jgi:hypothetical protein